MVLLFIQWLSVDTEEFCAFDGDLLLRPHGIIHTQHAAHPHNRGTVIVHPGGVGAHNRFGNAR